MMVAEELLPLFIKPARRGGGGYIWRWWALQIYGGRNIFTHISMEMSHREQADDVSHVGQLSRAWKAWMRSSSVSGCRRTADCMFLRL